MSNLRVMIDREGEFNASLLAARALAEAARERQPTACETCTCAACEEARLLPKVQRILAAAAARRGL